jgi:hypothetical protein
MSIFKKRPCLSTLVFFSLLVSGCGEELKGELVMEGFDSGPQVKITLHSQLELDFPLDPDPQLQTADTDELGESDNKFIAGVYAKLRRSASLRSQRRLPEFKADMAYQSLKRYETIDPGRYVITIKKGPEKPDRIRKTVKIQDKPLIFAGRGYNISTFEKEMKPAIDVDYATHLLVIPPDLSTQEIEDKLDLKAGYSRDTKYLVYSSTRSAFGKLPPPLIETKPESLHSAESTIPLERNPDSVLLFPRREESLLVLRKAEKQFDLLVGNETLNKKQFQASSVKVPGTSKKTPSTLQ